MNPIIDEIKPSIDKIYEKYKDRGLTSIYLWGSVTTNDFDPLTSDIDSIAIVEDIFDEKLESEIQLELQNMNPAVKRCGFRVLYISELKEGVHKKSNLASYISPAFFVFDLPNWIHVAGKKYEQNNLTDHVPTVAEVMKFRVSEIVNRKWQDAAFIEAGREQYYLKCLWRIVHLKQLARGVMGPFSYTSVIQNADGEEKKIVTILNEIKTAHYDRAIYLKYISELNAFSGNLIESI
ncbi:MAG: hypothetical protein RLY57_446 [Candidatus Parcubacteria bacterium]|jgi:hypothetical protein